MENNLYLHDLNFENVIGVDEAGRGPLAGPVVAAAVKLKNYSEELDEINDSKKLTEKKREKLFDVIMEYFEVAVGISDVSIIDEINILNADFLAMRTAIADLKKKLKGKNFTILVDGNLKIRDYNGEQIPIVKGDSKSLCIAAASIIAKVTRDRLMIDYDKEFPKYGFAKHKGYGTKAHIEALRKNGMCKIHRKGFVKSALSKKKEE